MLELEQALEAILASVPASKSEVVPLAEAHRRVVAEQILMPADLPPFDNSSMDGYAVRARDISSAGPQNPVSLTLAGKIAAGETFHSELSAGQCVRIFTGSMLPAGADAVVMQEDTRLDANRPGEVLFLEAAKPWENIRFRGEDVKQGAQIAVPGEVLGAAQMALLAAGGVEQVSVGRQPTVALLATGSELKEAGGGSALVPGQIYESNRTALAPLIGGAGGVPKIFPIVPDNPEATRAALSRALAECDLVVTCGGVSVGELDFVKSAFEELDGQLQFWKVAIKPGRPFVFGRCGEKLLFGLPGNPVSAFVTFLLLTRPALLRWQGAARVGLPASNGVLLELFSNPDARRHFMRVTVDERGGVRSAGTQASHVLSSLALAGGLVDLPPSTTFPTGTTVQVLRWE
ncbi:MAG TPA: gephyrin-like molybdotransferase Glp [Verrucomicrobiae bacterium]|jgi:molybdopterin molybdotransferase|nr:gephyrin-like molybdotransferase Glp [Verrucomicrobiae bacterium]